MKRDMGEDRVGESNYLPLRKVAAVGIGNALEFYDFLTYSFFAIQIGHSFFPEKHGLLYSLAVFGVGFLTRPLGGLVLGMMGDRVGRRPAMVVSFSLIGLALLGIALTPSYAQIGIAAPILLVTFRLLQGFALGGEVGASTAFLVEAAPPERRGLYVSIQYMTQDFAVLVAGIVGFVLSELLTPDQLDDWGWRAAFLLGTAVIPVGFYLRRSLPETLDREEMQTASAKGRIPIGFVLLALLMTMATSTYIFGIDYITTYVQDSLKMSSGAAFGATVLIGLCATIGDPISGLLCDRFGRKRVMLSAVVAILLVVTPAFLAMTRLGGNGVVFAATALLATLQSMLIVPALTTIAETLPKSIRSGTIGVVYAVSTSIFGGSTQMVVKSLIDWTGNPLAPAWYICGIVAVGGLAMLAVKESAPCRTRPG
jgi:MFS family permease